MCSDIGSWFEARRFPASRHEAGMLAGDRRRDPHPTSPGFAARGHPPRKGEGYRRLSPAVAPPHEEVGLLLASVGVTPTRPRPAAPREATLPERGRDTGALSGGGRSPGVVPGGRRPNPEPRSGWGAGA